MICIFMMGGKELVSKDSASCTPNVKFFFCTLLSREIIQLCLIRSKNERVYEYEYFKFYVNED